MLNECIVGAKRQKQGCYILKNRDQTDDTRLCVVHYLYPDCELLITYDPDTKYIEGLNASTGIAIFSTTYRNREERPEKDSDKGKNILNALIKSQNVADAIRSMTNSINPVYGNTLICTKDMFCMLEHEEGYNPSLTKYDKEGEFVVRTNHSDTIGAGFKPKHFDDYISSQTRKAAVEVMLSNNDSFDNLLSSLNYPVYGDLNDLNPNRSNEYTKTTSQTGVDFANNVMKVVDIPGRQKMCKYFKVGDSSIKPKFKFHFEKYREPAHLPFTSWGFK